MNKVCEKLSTASTYENTNCLLKNTPNKHNKYVVNTKFKHFDDVSPREIFGRSRAGLKKKICPFLRQGICILNKTLCRALIPMHATDEGANHHD